MLDAGYEGPFDLEILGPRIEEEGYRAPIAGAWSVPARCSNASAPEDVVPTGRIDRCYA
jgi:hypothetical protein